MNNKAIVTSEQESEQVPTVLKWGYVIKQFIEALIKAKKGKQVGNFQTAINFFLKSIGLTEDSTVGTEVTEEFEIKIQLYIKFEIDRRVSKGTYGPRVSKIRKLKQFIEANFADSLRLQTLPESFGQKLTALITALGHTITSFWRTLPEGLVGYRNFHHWCRGKYLPSKKFIAAVATIEEKLGIPAGTLLLPKYLYVRHDLKVGHSAFGNKVRAARAKPYYVSTESLKGEFDGWFKHKTVAILPEGEERHAKGQWTSNEGAEFPTADIAEGFLKSFMGYCALPKDRPDPYLRGQGMKLEELSLALVADKELVEGYLEFIRLRSGLTAKPIEDPARAAELPEHMISADGKWEFYDKGGKYNKGSLTALAHISSLLRPGTGYLYQHPEFAEKLGARMTAASWHEQCVNTRSRVDVLRKQILALKERGDTEHYDFGRDPEEPIQWVLELKRPLLILQEIVKDMLDDLLPESVPELDRARQYRDLILLVLLCANPLRIRMFSIMEFGKHLIRRSDGSWWLRFNKRAFKNRRALKSHYEVKVAQELWPLLDKYWKEYHPILSKKTGSKHVFLAATAGKYLGRPMRPATLSGIIQLLTELYTPNGEGFRPHAFRHIIATDIIKKDPRLGFFLASIALHDKLETVEKEYIHLKTSEFFEPVNTHFSEAWSVVFESPLPK